jgi:hypothetical protein
LATLTPDNVAHQKTKSNFSQSIKNVGRWIEGKTLIQLVISLITLIAFVIGLLSDSLALSVSAPKLFTKLLIGIPFVIVFIFSLIMITLLHRRNQILNYSITQLGNANKLIRRAAEASPTKYFVETCEITFDILDNGDAHYTRLMKLRGVNTHIPWAIFHVGIVDGETIPLSKLKITIVDPSDNSELAFSVIEDFPSRKNIAVLLDPPAAPHYMATFLAEMVVPRAYVDLINCKPDQGSISIENRTGNFTLKVIAPRDYIFQSIRWFKLPPGECLISTQDGRSVLTWKGSRIPIGNYRYSLIIKK